MLHIIIPYYKHKYFEATLESLKGQRNQDFTVFIGDDASPESPEDILNKFKDSFQFRYKRYEKNLGGESLVHQWERCIQEIDFQQDDWMMILGDDDVLEENVVQEFYKNFSTFQNKTHLVRFATKVIDEQSKSISEVYTHPVWEHKMESFFRRIKGNTRGSLSEQIFSYQTYQKYGFRKYPLAWHSDDMAWLDFPQDMPVYSVNDATVFIRHSEDNITGKTDNLEEKNRASLQYLKEVIAEYAPLLPLKKRINIFLMYEGRLKNTRKLNGSDWRYLFGLYLRTFSPLYLAKLIRRIALYQLKTH